MEQSNVATGVKLVASGLCLAKFDSGEIVFVEGLLPEETARVAENRSKGKTKFGEIVELLEVSESRVDPPCEYVEHGCGGCDWQHISLDAQREYKREIVVDALSRIAKLENAENIVDEAIELESERYRTTARIICDSQNWGFRARHSHEMVRVQDCMVLHEECQQQAVDVVDSIEQSLTENSELKDELNEAQVRRSPDVFMGVNLSVSRESFYQGHIQAPEKLSELLLEATGKSDKPMICVDLFSGVGVLALALANEGHKVIAVEGNPHAIGDAVKNLQGFNTKIVHSDVKKFRYDEDAFGGKCDLVVADPSREGIAKHAIDAVLSCKANKVVLISCDPAAGARDIALLIENGYKLKSCVPIDMFSYTHHVEMFSVLEL